MSVERPGDALAVDPQPPRRRVHLGHHQGGVDAVEVRVGRGEGAEPGNPQSRRPSARRRAGDAGAGSTTCRREATASRPPAPFRVRPSTPAPAEAAAAAVAAITKPRRSQSPPERAVGGAPISVTGPVARRPVSTYRSTAPATRPGHRGQRVRDAGRVGPSGRRDRPHGPEEQHTGRRRAAEPQSDNSQDHREKRKDGENSQLENQFVVGAEMPDRPVLDRGGRAVDRGAADGDDRTGLRADRTRHGLGDRERCTPGQGTAERAQQEPDRTGPAAVILLVLGHVGNPVLKPRRIGRTHDRMNFLFPPIRALFGYGSPMESLFFWPVVECDGGRRHPSGPRDPNSRVTANAPRCPTLEKTDLRKTGREEPPSGGVPAHRAHHRTALSRGRPSRRAAWRWAASNRPRVRR